MSSHKFSCRYTMGETIKILHDDSDIDESDEEDKSKDIQAYEGDSLSDENF